MKKLIVLLLTGCATSWPATKSEQLALVTLANSANDIDREVAPVISDAKMRRAVVNYLWMRFESIESAKRELLDEVAARHGVRQVRFDPATVSWVSSGSP